MAIVAALSYVLLLASSVVSQTDPALRAIFFQFGTDVGDSIVPVADDGSSPAINIPGGFPFFTLNTRSVYVSHQ